jgi:hypothetical protein
MGIDVAGLVWPFALTLWATLLRWKQLRSRTGFLVAGVLGCFGLQAFLARLTRYVFWTYVAPLEPYSYWMAHHLAHPIVIIVASAALSVPLLLWLTALLGVVPKPAPGKSPEREESAATRARVR